MRKAIDEGLEAARRSRSTSTWVMSNHDVPRHASRYALPQVDSPVYHQLAHDWLLCDGSAYPEDRAVGERRARAAILMELALPGSAYIYQGEELGLFEVADLPWDRLEDPTAFRTSRSEMDKGRDGCRVPLPWVAADAPVTDSADDEFGHGGSFGFSPKTRVPGAGVDESQRGLPAEEPHLPQPRWFAHHAADVEERDPDSMLTLYRRALELRHRLMPTDTTLTWLDGCGPNDAPGADGHRGGVIAYRRSNGWASVTNLSSEPVPLPDGEVLLTSVPLESAGVLPTDASAWIRAKK